MFSDLRYALRTLFRSPGYTAVAVIVLALGIGANTAVFSVINAVLLRPLPYRNPGELCLIRERMPLFTHGSVSLPNYLDWRAGQHSFTDLAIVDRESGNLSFSQDGQSTPERVNTVVASANFLSILGQRPALGRDITEAEDTPGGPKVILLSDGLWRRRFGADPQVVGRHVIYDAVEREIIGVLPPEFVYANSAEALLPLGDVRSARWATERDNHPGFTVVGRLRPGTGIESARADLNVIAVALEAKYPASNTGRRVMVEGLLDAAIASYRSSLYLLLGAVACVLLAACANVASLQLSRAAGRQRELAVRAALGADRWRLMRQMLAESMLLGLFGGIAGILLALWAVDAIVAISPADQSRFRDIRLDWIALSFAAATALGTGILVGAWPAWRMSQIASMASALHEGSARGASSGASKARARAILVVTQVALAVVLMAGAGLALNRFRRVRDLPLGFDPRGVLTVSISLPEAKYKKEAIYQFYDALLERVSALPDVVAAAVGVNVPFDDNEWDSGVHITGTPPYKPGENPSAEMNFVSPDYFKVLGIPIRRGRVVDKTDIAGGELVVVVDDSFAEKFFPGRDPVGQYVDDNQSLDQNPPPMRIIGVVGRTRNDGPDASIYLDKMTQMTRSSDQFPNQSRILLVKVADGDPRRLVEPIRRAVLGLDPDIPIAQVSTMEGNIATSLAAGRLTMVLLGVFAAIALGLATVGLYGVMALSVTQRTRELGIRLALGAQRVALLLLVLRQGATLVAIGLGIGASTAVALGRFADWYAGVNFLGSASLLILAGVCALLGVVALLACWLPARRATRLDPLVALRAE